MYFASPMYRFILLLILCFIRKGLVIKAWGGFYPHRNIYRSMQPQQLSIILTQSYRGSNILPSIVFGKDYLSKQSSQIITRLSSSINNDIDEIKHDVNTSTTYQYALLFDCDGVILETEELHRLAYNAAFNHYNLTIQNQPVVWSVEYYDMLQNTVGGGKPKMMYHFRNTMNNTFPNYGVHQRLPETTMEQTQLIDDLQDYKTKYFKTLLETKAQARPGVLELMDAALNDPTIAVGVCSAATKEAAIKTLDITLGSDRVQRLNVCLLGDDIPTKKPDPLIYTTACQRLNMVPSQCIVIEDSLVGLRAAVSANMKCIITYTSSTANQDFYAEGAIAKIPDLGSRNVTLESIFGPLREGGNDADILVGIKDE